MKNPYEVLGVDENISDEELNRVYKKLAKKYHPDINPSNDAAEKMVEINCAYDAIKKMREEGVSFSSYNSANSYAYSNNDLYNQIAQLINQRRFFEAYIILQTITSKDGRWYYYSAYIIANMGSLELAKKYIDEALKFEPSNNEYIKLKEMLGSVKVSHNERNYNLMPSLYRIIFLAIFVFSIFSCVSRF